MQSTVIGPTGVHGQLVLYHVFRRPVHRVEQKQEQEPVLILLLSTTVNSAQVLVVRVPHVRLQVIAQVIVHCIFLDNMLQNQIWSRDYDVLLIILKYFLCVSSFVELAFVDNVGKLDLIKIEM